MNAPRPLLPLDEALQRLAAAAAAHRIADAETVSTFEARGRVLAAEVRATIAVPGADNSAMDGYALRCADVPAAGAVLPVSQRIAAGHVGRPLQGGTAARIFTGALVPEGADAVLMQEHCEALDGGAAVRVNTVPAPGLAIRRRGEDVAEGAVVLAAGLRLQPQALGLAASVGVAALPVLRRPRVAILCTGDELAMPGEPLKPGALYNSNRFTLRALAEAAGCAVTDLGNVPDRLDATREALRRAAAGHDLIVTSGGVSVGEEDHLKPAAEAEGRLENWQLAIKPGKPLAFGAIRRPDGSEALLVGLPGNPVSSFVTWLLAVHEVLAALQGLPGGLPAELPLGAGFDWPRTDTRREVLRVRVGADGRLVLFPNQGSGVLTSTVWADGLVDVPPGQAIRAGDAVAYRPLAGWLKA
ncbi:MAG: gephyrin-like molybdotransferase Glp [Betaproteobacteria bacterium]